MLWGKEHLQLVIYLIFGRIISYMTLMIIKNYYKKLLLMPNIIQYRFDILGQLNISHGSLRFIELVGFIGLIAFMPQLKLLMNL